MGFARDSPLQVPPLLCSQPTFCHFLMLLEALAGAAGLDGGEGALVRLREPSCF